MFPHDLQESIRQAWEEFEGSFDIDANKKRIAEMSGESIRRAGLLGAQLRLKVEVIGRFRQMWIEKLGKKWLKFLLSAIDTLLKSIIAAAGIDKALEEIKDILLNALDLKDGGGDS